MKPQLSKTYPEMLRENPQKHGNTLAAISGDRRITYSALLDRARPICARLRGIGVRRGDRVGMIMSNRIEWLEICFGASRAGAVVVPFSAWSTHNELEFLIADSRVSVLFSLQTFGDRDFLSGPSALDAAGIDVIAVGASGDLPGAFDFSASLTDVVELAGQLPPDEGPMASDDALVVCTSGSTSAPKGVRLKHYGAAENGYNIGKRQVLRESDRVLLSAALIWSYGGANCLPATFSHSACLVLL